MEFPGSAGSTRETMWRISLVLVGKLKMTMKQASILLIFFSLLRGQLTHIRIDVAFFDSITRGFDSRNIPEEWENTPLSWKYNSFARIRVPESI
jgi:hypothetical protein